MQHCDVGDNGGGEVLSSGGEDLRQSVIGFVYSSSGLGLWGVEAPSLADK